MGCVDDDVQVDLREPCPCTLIGSPPIAVIEDSLHVSLTSRRTCDPGARHAERGRYATDPTPRLEESGAFQPDSRTKPLDGGSRRTKRRMSLRISKASPPDGCVHGADPHADRGGARVNSSCSRSHAADSRYDHDESTCEHDGLALEHDILALESNRLAPESRRYARESWGLVTVCPGKARAQIAPVPESTRPASESHGLECEHPGYAGMTTRNARVSA
jgi:hypothetical protein